MTSRLSLAAVALYLCSALTYAQTTETFIYTGAAQSWVVPAGVTEVTIEAWGAEGSRSEDRLPDNATGGLGGYAMGTLAVTPGETLEINVGGFGTTDGTNAFNGGGAGGFGTAGSSCVDTYGGGGGGASDVRQGGSSLADRIIVAGGGGGGGSDYCNGSCQPCGCGGAGGDNADLLGDDGSPAFDGGFGYGGNGVNFGGGAQLASGGLAGPQDNGATNVGTPGAPGIGGSGSNGTQGVAGGGGGGGYYGGGGGGGAVNGSGVAGGGGGAGSSYVGGVTAGSTTAAVRSGAGEIVLTYTATAAEPEPEADAIEPETIPVMPFGGLLITIGLLGLGAYRRLSA